MKTITINVTQRDIDNATGQMSHQCPIYQSMQRHKKLKGWIAGVRSVHNEHIVGDFAMLPPKAQKFSWAHYLGRKVKPITFKIKINYDSSN